MTREQNGLREFVEGSKMKHAKCGEGRGWRIRIVNADVHGCITQVPAKNDAKPGFIRIKFSACSGGYNLAVTTKNERCKLQFSSS